MTHLERLVLTLLIIFFSLASGYSCRHMAGKGYLPVSAAFLEVLRQRLQTLAIFGLLPASAMLSLWGLPKPDPSLLALPILGIAAYAWGGALALVASRLMGLDRSQTGSFYCCGTFANIGAIGGLVCLLFLGENSIALVALYRLFEEVYYFSVSFPVARWYGHKNNGAKLSFRNFTFNPILCIILGALFLGIGLNLMGIPRPVFCGTLASVLMLLATLFFLFAIGLTLRLSRLSCYSRQGFAMCAIKFLGVPVVITLLAKGMGYGTFDDGLALKVVAVLSSMPVAMTALAPPAMFKLDVDLANACWLFSTAGLLLALPALMLILPAL